MALRSGRKGKLERLCLGTDCLLGTEVRHGGFLAMQLRDGEWFLSKVARARESNSGVDVLNISESVLTTTELEGELRFHGYFEQSFSRILHSPLEHSLTPLRFSSRPSAAEILQPMERAGKRIPDRVSSRRKILRISGEDRGWFLAKRGGGLVWLQLKMHTCSSPATCPGLGIPYSLLFPTLSQTGLHVGRFVVAAPATSESQSGKFAVIPSCWLKKKSLARLQWAV
ncbi:hypothetical protein BJY00DRAFT_294172, partial [Aspergillus carlsbadensis]